MRTGAHVSCPPRTLQPSQALSRSKHRQASPQSCCSVHGTLAKQTPPGESSELLQRSRRIIGGLPRCRWAPRGRWRRRVRRGGPQPPPGLAHGPAAKRSEVGEALDRAEAPRGPRRAKLTQRGGLRGAAEQRARPGGRQLPRRRRLARDDARRHKHPTTRPAMPRREPGARVPHRRARPGVARGAGRRYRRVRRRLPQVALRARRGARASAALPPREALQGAIDGRAWRLQRAVPWHGTDPHMHAGACAQARRGSGRGGGRRGRARWWWWGAAPARTNPPPRPSGEALRLVGRVRTVRATGVAPSCGAAPASRGMRALRACAVGSAPRRAGEQPAETRPAARRAAAQGLQRSRRATPSR
jgi:hypothetical protein